MTVLGFDHVQLAYPPGGEAAARRFYGEILGFTEIPKPLDMQARGGMWFEAGPIQIHLGVEPEMRASTKMHPALRVSELSGYLARLREAGCEWKPGTDIPGVQRGHTKDPFGNRIELIEGVSPH
jgi:catechol 2,3-dioxygenase-like lactoylglutathione lyase family enzyme